MMDQARLTMAVLKCETKHQAEQLIRNEAAAVVACFEDLSLEHARIRTLASIGFLTVGLTEADAARICEMFNVQPGLIGLDLANGKDFSA